MNHDHMHSSAVIIPNARFSIYSVPHNAAVNAAPIEMSQPNCSIYMIIYAAAAVTDVFYGWRSFSPEFNLVTWTVMYCHGFGRNNDVIMNVADVLHTYYVYSAFTWRSYKVEVYENC